MFRGRLNPWIQNHGYRGSTLKFILRDFPGGPVENLHCSAGDPVPSLVRELRSPMMQSNKHKRHNQRGLVPRGEILDDTTETRCSK